MMIHDLEFFNSCAQEDQKGNFAISGGSSASTNVYTSASGDNVYAETSVSASGDYSGVATATRATIINTPNYSSGYSSGYAAGYGVDPYTPVSRSQSSGISIL